MPQLGAAGPDRPRQQSLPCRRSFNPLFRRAGSIAPPLGPPRRAGVEHALGRGCTVCVGRPSVVWLCGLYGRSPVLVQYAPRWLYRALKKTPEAPYTTKVNYRKPTSRGTTHFTQGHSELLPNPD